MTRKRKQVEIKTTPVTKAPNSKVVSPKIRLITSNKEERNIRNIVIAIMFTAGDSYIPLCENENLVIDLLKNELILILEDILELRCHTPGKIEFAELLGVLQGQKGMISRFLAYLVTRIEMTKIMKPKSFSKKCRENIYGEELESDEEKDYPHETEEVDEVDDIGHVEGEEGEYLEKKRKKFMATSSEEELLISVRAEFKKLGLKVETYENFEDEMCSQRNAALMLAIEEMSREDYAKFTMSRRVTFQKNSNSNTAVLVEQSKTKARGRKSTKPVNSLASLIAWIGNPPLHGEAAEILFAFIAKELIFLIVGSALLEKNREPENLFTNDRRGEENTLQVRHYEEVLRKNENYRKYGRFLV